MKYNLSVTTDIGKIRKKNEDNFYINGSMRKLVQDKLSINDLIGTEPLICAVFDGMGGEACGETASEICATEAIDLFNKAQSRHLREDDVNEYVRRANDRIVDSITDDNTRYAGSTMAMVYISNGIVYTYSLGDSRVYLLRGNELLQITHDHTLAMRRYLANIYTKEEAENSPDRHKLISFVGVDIERSGIKAESYSEFKALDNDKILICSDGLYDMCNETEIVDILSKDSAAPSYDLTNAALNNGGGDNITCLVIQVKE